MIKIALHLTDLTGFEASCIPSPEWSDRPVVIRRKKKIKNPHLNRLKHTTPALSVYVRLVYCSYIHAVITMSYQASISAEYEAAVARCVCPVEVSDCANQAEIMNGQLCRLTPVLRKWSDKAKRQQSITVSYWFHIISVITLWSTY